MSNLKVSFDSRSQLIMHLHAVKYHSFDCFGLFIGKATDKSVTVTDCVPLFHQSVTTGATEVAFDMVQSIHVPQGHKIVGMYEAAMPINLPGGR